jgi:hypothetical protein
LTKATKYQLEDCLSGQCEVLGKSTSLLGFQPPTPFNPLQDSQSLKDFQSKAFGHFVKMSDRELRTVQLSIMTKEGSVLNLWIRPIAVIALTTF